MHPNLRFLRMEWITNLFTSTESVAHIVLLYAIVIAVGVYLGKIKIGGVSLGVTFVLFAGIVAGHIHFTAPQAILNFGQDFGLILFVFMIGLQVGPGFFESFRKDGVTLNRLATATILLNIAVMFGCYYLFFDTSNPYNLPMLVGTLYGAVTNTPALGAASPWCGGHYTGHDSRSFSLQGEVGRRGSPVAGRGSHQSPREALQDASACDQPLFGRPHPDADK